MISETTAWYSLIGILLLVMILGAYKMNHNAECRQSAVAQNYPADAIKKICR